MLSRTLILIILGSYLQLHQACSMREFDPSDSTATFESARKTYSSGSHEIAIVELREFIARFPYSQHTADAELLVANSHFELSQFEDAVFEYEQFLKLHPNHPKLDFVMYRIGECYWREAPEEVDREQEFTRRAMSEWERLLKRFPKSSYALKAQKQMQSGLRRLAESEMFIAKYYCKQRIYHACAQRYVGITERFRTFPAIRAEALRQAALAFAIMAKQKAEKPERVDNLFFRDLSAQQLANKARALLNESKQSSSTKGSKKS